jgi:1-acyl-sn-glycerol-3-phosphate acyltransferase
MRWERVENPTREQQQVVADEVLKEIRLLYAGLQEHGRKGILQRVRAERRTAKNAVAA